MYKYILFFLPLICFGGSVNYKFGTGLSHGGINIVDGKVSLFSLSHEREISSLFQRKLETGVWADSSGKGRLGSAYGNYSIGVSVEPVPFYVNTFVGVAGISSPDVFLSTFFQFTHDIAIGIEDKKHRRFGLSFKHISNAGIKSPNIGRNFIQIGVGVPW
jgi:hypothetical protein